MCPSCHSTQVTRSRKRKLRDRIMRWMGKVAYRCRECQRRFYVNIDVDRRMRGALEWQKKSAEHVSGVTKKPDSQRVDDLLDDYEIEPDED